MDITTYTPGSFCTAGLRTRDLQRSAAFYGALVGWTAQELPGTPGHRC
jgi:predicted enzyme related to lactoylglutathione lyase